MAIDVKFSSWAKSMDNNQVSKTIELRIREIIAAHGRMAHAESLTLDQDLYQAGLTSFAAVQIMLAIEEAFDVEFPETMLNRRSFASIESIRSCVSEISNPQAAA
jgi:acyl carrier protein